MTIRLYMSMSLDGYIAGPDDREGQELGRSGGRLFNWLDERNGPGINGQVYAEALSTGAIISGRRTFELAGRWNEWLTRHPDEPRHLVQIRPWGASGQRHETTQLAGRGIALEVRRRPDRDLGIGEAGTAECGGQVVAERLEVEPVIRDCVDVDPGGGLPHLVLRDLRDRTSSERITSGWTVTPP